MLTEQYFISLYVSDDKPSAAMHSTSNYMQSLSHKYGCKPYRDNGTSWKYILVMSIAKIQIIFWSIPWTHLYVLAESQWNSMEINIWNGRQVYMHRVINITAPSNYNYSYTTHICGVNQAVVVHCICLPMVKSTPYYPNWGLLVSLRNSR